MAQIGFQAGHDTHHGHLPGNVIVTPLEDVNLTHDAAHHTFGHGAHHDGPSNIMHATRLESAAIPAAVVGVPIHPDGSYNDPEIHTVYGMRPTAAPLPAQGVPVLGRARGESSGGPESYLEDLFYETQVRHVARPKYLRSLSRDDQEFYIRQAHRDYDANVQRALDQTWGARSDRYSLF